MSSGQQKAENDARQRQAGVGENSLEPLAEVHRGGQTKGQGEHLGAAGYQESKGYEENKDHREDQTKEELGTRSNNEDGSGEAGRAPAIDERLDIDESTGYCLVTLVD